MKITANTFRVYSRFTPVAWALRPHLALGLLLLFSYPLARAAEPKVTEAFSMEIVGLPLDHQGPQVIDLTVKLTYVESMTQKDYPDFEVIHREIKAFLAGYPNEKDYIEVVNKKLCLDLLTRYAPLASVAIDIKLYPTMTIPYVQVSHCLAAR